MHLFTARLLLPAKQRRDFDQDRQSDLPDPMDEPVVPKPQTTNSP